MTIEDKLRDIMQDIENKCLARYKELPINHDRLLDNSKKVIEINGLKTEISNLLHNAWEVEGQITKLLKELS